MRPASRIDAIIFPVIDVGSFFKLLLSLVNVLLVPLLRCSVDHLFFFLAQWLGRSGLFLKVQTVQSVIVAFPVWVTCAARRVKSAFLVLMLVTVGDMVVRCTGVLGVGHVIRRSGTLCIDAGIVTGML